MRWGGLKENLRFESWKNHTKTIWDQKKMLKLEYLKQRLKIVENIYFIVFIYLLTASHNIHRLAWNPVLAGSRGNCPACPCVNTALSTSARNNGNSSSLWNLSDLNFYDNKWTLAFVSVDWGTSTLLCLGAYNAVKTALLVDASKPVYLPVTHKE
jgi:hypothetical protein